jgi:chemotaxis signal transduction protein
MDQFAFLQFRAAGRVLALPLGDVRRVEPLPLLAAPIGTPHFVEGYFDYRGAPVAALRLDRLLDLAEDTLGLYTPLLLLAEDNPAIALHVGRVDAIRRIRATDIQPIGKDGSFNECVVGRISDGSDTVYLLSAENLLLAEERATVAAHTALMRQRLDALTTKVAYATRD